MHINATFNAITMQKQCKSNQIKHQKSNKIVIRPTGTQLLRNLLNLNFKCI